METDYSGQDGSSVLKVTPRLIITNTCSEGTVQQLHYQMQEDNNYCLSPWGQKKILPTKSLCHFHQQHEWLYHFIPIMPILK